jgi:hypothetical protein
MPPADHDRDERLQRTVAAAATPLYPDRQVIARFGECTVGAFLAAVAEKGLAGMMAEFPEPHGYDLAYSLKMVALACLFYVHMPEMRVQKGCLLEAEVGKAAKPTPFPASTLVNGLLALLPTSSASARRR